MRRVKRIGFYLLAVCLLLTDSQVLRAGKTASAGKPAVGQHPLWGDLQPGPYRVGFRVQYAFDRSRTWQTTRPYEKGFAPDREGRPIRISIWYPAQRDHTRQMRFADYSRVPGPTGFAELNAMIATHNRVLAGLTVPADRLEAYLATPVNAYANAEPAAGKFPLILYTGGSDNDVTANVMSQSLGDTGSNTVLAEFLASYGYIVATVPVLRSGELVAPAVRSATETESAVRDLEFAWSQLRDLPTVDPGRLGVIGHGLGGIRALLFAMRNANVSAVVGLNGYYGFKGGVATFTGLYDYAPLELRGALLDVRREEGEGPLKPDLSAVEQLHYADRYLVSVRKMHHQDFTAFAAAAKLFGLPPDFEDPSGWTRETGYRGYQDVCLIVRDFLDARLKSDEAASHRLDEDVARSDGGTLKREAAIPSPPTREEMVAIVTRQGLPAATAIVDRYRQLAPKDVIVSEGQFNSIGYDLLAQHKAKEAIAVFRLVAYAYPDSANASDSLGDGYLGAGQKEQARLAFEHALQLINEDPRFKDYPQAKEFFVSQEREKLKQFN